MLASDPFSGSLYVLRPKRADLIKIVWWDGSGVCLYAKRLEKAHVWMPPVWQKDFLTAVSERGILSVVCQAS
ncbi:IS66 family insertion sequence element accessory protein TnpB [Agrobacterium sp. El2ro-1b]|uniref:IS66 family insertion sequence element accessory protein TnpB n=1 Tax=Agrobacterium sp. El2ro-1b TaxID=2969528 RepID=UPI003AAF8714